jgi:hypothetical protein
MTVNSTGGPNKGGLERAIREFRSKHGPTTGAPMRKVLQDLENGEYVGTALVRRELQVRRLAVYVATLLAADDRTLIEKAVDQDPVSQAEEGLASLSLTTPLLSGSECSRAQPSSPSQ